MYHRFSHQRLAVRATILTAIMIVSIITAPVAGTALSHSSPAVSSASTVSQSPPFETTKLAVDSDEPMQVSPPAVERDGADAVLQSSGLYWAGQDLGVTIPESVSAADTIELRRYNSENTQAGSFVREFGLGTDRSLEIPTAGLDGRYMLVATGNRSQAFRVDSDGIATDLVDPRDAHFEIAEQSLRVEWGQDRITTGDDDVSLDIRSNRIRYNLKVSADRLDYDDLESLFRSGGAANNPTPYADRQPFAVDGVVYDAYADDDELVIRGLRDGSLTADFTQIDPGSYRFTFEVTDTGVTSGAPVGDEDSNEELPEVEPDPAFFALTDLDPTSATVESGDSLTVSTTVTNIGGTAATQTVDVRIDNDSIATEEISLDPDERETVSFDIESPDEPGLYMYSVHTTDTSVVGELTVESSEAEPEPDPEPEPETDDDTPGFGVIVALVALITAALLLISRRR